MATTSGPLSGAEWSELFTLEREARGVPAEEIDASLRARLEALRSGIFKPENRPRLSVEARLATLEDEVKRLRELIERKNG